MTPQGLEARLAGPPDSAADEWFTVAQTAEALGLAVSTVYRQIGQGRITTVRVGREHRISPLEIARYRHAHLGGAGWSTRRTPGFTPSPAASQARRYYVRQRGVGSDLSPSDVEVRLTGLPDPATVASVLAAVRADAAWSVQQSTRPGRVDAIALHHHPSGRTYSLRRRRGGTRWRFAREEPERHEGG